MVEMVFTQAILEERGIRPHTLSSHAIHVYGRNVADAITELSIILRYSLVNILRIRPIYSIHVYGRNIVDANHAITKLSIILRYSSVSFFTYSPNLLVFFVF